MSNRKQFGGFTLIEVMVVLVILGILATLVVPRIMGRPDEARIIAAKQDIGSIAQGLDLYRLDNHAYPTTDQGLQALISKPTAPPAPPNWKTGGYLTRSSVPKDPWGNEFKYIIPGVKNTSSYDLFSLGADGAPGGEGNDGDIGNWEK